MRHGVKVVTSPDYGAAADFIRSVPALFGRGGGEVLHEGRNSVHAFGTPEGRFVVKRYKRPNLIQAVAYTYFKKSKAERAYVYAGMMIEAGFFSPRPVAYIEIRRRGLLCDSYFISEESTWQPVIDLLDCDEPDLQAADDVALLVFELHESGILHGDLNLSNILCKKNKDGRYDLALIDLNRSKFLKREPSKKERFNNMKRLTHNHRLMAIIAAYYAAYKHWDKDDTVAAVMAALYKFERRCIAKDKVKAWFKRKA